MSDSTRPRGVIVYPMPDDVTGPFDQYALAVRDPGTGPLEVRMVHTEGVAYAVTADKPWTWNDYNPDGRRFTIAELLDSIDHDNTVDLADWVRTFGARLESNFNLIYRWCQGA